MTDHMKDKLILAGVKNLNQFGYEACTKENIMTDDVYKEFFKSMLNDNKGNGPTIDAAIDELLQQIGN